MQELKLYLCGTHLPRFVDMCSSNERKDRERERERAGEREREAGGTRNKQEIQRVCCCAGERDAYIHAVAYITTSEGPESIDAACSRPR